MQLQINYVDLILVFVVFAVSLNLLMGYTGQVSVAHGAFGAVGGYALAYLFLNEHWQTFAGIGVGVGLAAVAGIIVGIPALRLTTEWLILLTLAAQIIVVSLAQTASQLGGTYGLQNVTPLEVFGHPLLQPSDLLPLFAAFAAVVVFICWRMGESPYGRVLRGIREDELACRALGKNVFTYKLTVFGVTCAMAGLAGAMLVITNQIASPALFGFDLSTTIVAMVIFGGMGNLFGSIVGATVLVLLGPFFEHVLSFNAQKSALWRLVAYGLVLVVVMLLRPQGLLPEGFAPIRSTRAWVAKRRHEKLTPELEAAQVHGGALVDVAPVVEEDAAPPPVPHARPPVELTRESRSAPTGEIVLQVHGLTKRFGGITAAYDLSMQLVKGTVTALVGPNGAGKTTVYNLLTGAIRPDSGRVVLKGDDITAMRPDQVALRGMVRSFQDVRVFARLTALQNVMLAVPGQPGERVLSLFGRWVLSSRTERQVRDRAMRWLEFVGMADFAAYPAGALAFGQQKLVALARVLATESDVVLLDEPSSGIDEQWVDVMLGLIEQMRPQGRTVCIVEHNLHVVGRLADHVYFMELGRITAQGSFEELTHERRLAEAYFGTA